MDYSPINIAPKGKKQGDYYSTTLGPYDYWAIEYAYKPIDGDEAAELKKIAARAPSTTWSTRPTRTRSSTTTRMSTAGTWVRPLPVRPDRIALAAELLKDLDARVVKDGESWARTRRAFGMLLEQWGDGATLASQFIGGQSVSRDHKADKDARDPIVPVPGAKQRDCLKFLAENILSDKAFQFSPALLRRLGTERWMHWGDDSLFGPGIDISVLERILGIQKIVLGHCLSSATLARLQNQQLQADPGSDPLRMEEVFRALTDGIWSDLDKLPDHKDAKRPRSRSRRSAATSSASTSGGSAAWCSAIGPALAATRSSTSSSCGGGSRRAGRRPCPGPAAPQGDRRPDRHGSGDQERQPRRHQPGSPRGDAASDRQGPRGESRHQGALSDQARSEPRIDVPPGPVPRRDRSLAQEAAHERRTQGPGADLSAAGCIGVGTLGRRQGTPSPARA